MDEKTNPELCAAIQQFVHTVDVFRQGVLKLVSELGSIPHLIAAVEALLQDGFGTDDEEELPVAKIRKL